MKSRRRGGLIFVSAVLSMTAGGPMLSNYFATKAFNLFFGEGLETEFKKHNVDVLVLCPGPTQTELYARVFKEFMTMNANVVARTALKNLGRKSRVVPGFLNRFQISFLKLLPRSLLKIRMLSIPCENLISGEKIKYGKKNCKPAPTSKAKS